MTGIEAVVFDVGETLVDETSAWEAWADHLSIPRFTFMAAFGAIVSHGDDHRRIFELLAPQVAVTADPPGWERSADDLYADAAPTIRSLAARGIRTGVAGNQAAATGDFFTGLGLPLDVVGTSQEWGVAKPDPRFFTRIADEFDLPPAAIAYVGDRVDNDVRPAMSLGMKGVLIQRGPWGITVDTQTALAAASLVVTSLTDILDELG